MACSPFGSSLWPHLCTQHTQHVEHGVSMSTSLWVGHGMASCGAMAMDGLREVCGGWGTALERPCAAQATVEAMGGTYYFRQQTVAVQNNR